MTTFRNASAFRSVTKADVADVLQDVVDSYQIAVHTPGGTVAASGIRGPLRQRSARVSYRLVAWARWRFVGG